MIWKQRNPEPLPATPDGAPAPAGSLLPASDAVRRLTLAGDHVIRATLSTDSRTFLSAQQQQGGQ